MLFAQALRQTRGLGQCLHYRREEATGSVHTARALGWGTVGDCLHSFPGTPLPPTTLPHIGGRRHLNAHFSMGLFMRVPGMAPGGKPVCPWDRWPRRCCPLGTRGTGQACLLPRLLPQSGERAPALVVHSCLLSSQASISPHRERVTLVLPLACCSCTASYPAS